MSNENMRLWDLVKDPDTTLSDKATKEFSGKGGFKGTAIDPMTLYAMATRLWGSEGLIHKEDVPQGYSVPQYPCWGFERISSEIIAHEFVTRVRFWYPDTDHKVMKCIEGVGCTPIDEGRNGEPRPVNDVAKKTETDARTNAMSKAGFGANVYLGKYNDSRYVEEVKQRQRAAVTANDPDVVKLRQDFANISGDLATGAVTTEQAIDRFKALYSDPFKALPQAGKDALAGGVNALQAELRERKAEGK